MYSVKSGTSRRCNYCLTVIIVIIIIIIIIIFYNF